MRLLLVTVLLLGGAASLEAQERSASSAGISAPRAASIAAARDLYASARYDEALAVLNGLLSGEPASVADVKVIEQYRSFCLLALGRADEAEAAIAAVVAADPFYQPREEDVAPRIRTTFADVRRRLLPEIATARYAAAKQAYDRKEFADAERQFRDLVTLLSDPQMDGRHGDMRTLAAGFLDLSTAAAAPVPEPKREEPPPPPAAPAAPAAPRIYAMGEPGLVPPVTIRQDLPPVPASITAATREQGLIEIVIDQQGRVSSMALRTRVHPVYDGILLAAARDWKYRPALLNGAPVSFRKLIQFTVRK